MRYFRALSVSLIFHVVAFVLFAWLSPKIFFDPDALNSAPVVVDLLETPELPRRPVQLPLDTKTFVRSARVPKELQTDEQRKKRFASAEDQTVLEEQQARASGLTANRSSQASMPGEAEGRERPKPQAQKDRKLLDLKPKSTISRLAEEELQKDIGDIAVGKQRDSASVQDQPAKALDFSRIGNLERGMSTTGESLPADIKFGDFTALNTDRHLFYSFYSRIEEMVRPRWVNYAKAVIYGIQNGSQLVNEGRITWTTKLEVILDKRGHYVRTILHDSSGAPTLDAAPTQAFKDAALFPNPPAEMVKEDGNIHIYYAFSVNLVPRYAANNVPARAADETPE